MEINVKKKTFVLSISRRKSENLIMHNYKLSDQVIRRAEKVKILGVTINDKLNWYDQIYESYKQASQLLRFSRRILREAPESTKLAVYKVLISLKLEYASTIWDPHCDKYIDMLESVQSSAVRFITNSFGRDVCVTNKLISLNLPLLQTRRQEARLVQLYKIINNNTIVNPIEYIETARYFGKNDHNLKLNLLQKSRDYTRYEFFSRTIFEWNALPKIIVNSKDYKTFRENLIVNR